MKKSVAIFLLCVLFMSMLVVSLPKIKAENKTEQTTWTFQPTVKIPSFDITMKCLALDYAPEGYNGITPGQSQGPIHFDSSSGLGFLSNGGLSTLPLLGNNVTIEISNNTNQISSSFSFEAKGYTVNADLKGTIRDNAVSFNITYDFPAGFQNYETPIDVSLMGSEIVGTSYTTLPPQITAYYTGVLTNENNQNIVRGSFRFSYEPQSEWVNVYETISGYQTQSSTQQTLLLKGQFEYYVTNLQIDGTFVLAQKELTAVIMDPFSFQIPDPQLINSISQSLSDIGFKVKYISGSTIQIDQENTIEGTVQWLKDGKLNADLIFWRGHGGPSKSGVCLGTSEMETPALNQKYESDLESKTVIKVDATGFPNCPEKTIFYAITPSFIDQYYSNKLSNSLIFVESCDSLHDTSMGNSFLGYSKDPNYHGKGAYIGFNSEIKFYEDNTGPDAAVSKVFSNLCNGFTVSQAVKGEYKSLEWWGNGNLKLSQLGKTTENNPNNNLEYGVLTSSTATVKNNYAVANHLSLTGVNVIISDSSLTDGTPFIVSSVNFGSSQPNGTSSVNAVNATFFDVKITPDSTITLNENMTAQISFSDNSFTPNSAISYWDGNNWIPIAASFEEPNTVVCSIPVSSLTGTFFMVYSANLLDTSQYLLIAAIVTAASLVVFAAFIRHRMTSHRKYEMMLKNS